MHNATKRVSDKSSVAKGLLEGLNGGRYSAQIVDLLEEIREVNRLDALHREANEHWTSISIEVREIVRLQKTIKGILQGYPMIPMLRIGQDGWTHSFNRPASAKEKSWRDYALLAYIHEACELGLLSKLARCEYARCGKWFLRRVVGQRFHTSRCREYAFKSTTEWRAYRAKKAREYYRLHRDKNIK
jgi:hypothetical protein